MGGLRCGRLPLARTRGRVRSPGVVAAFLVACWVGGLAVLRAGAPALQAGSLCSPVIVAGADFEAGWKYSLAEGGTALVVLRAGRVVFERYAGGGDPERAVWVMSITKSLVAVAGFAAEAEGLLDLDEEVEGREGVTLRMLLDQTSGLEPGHSVIYGRGVGDKTRAALGLDGVTAPGARFDYGPGNFEIFGETLRRKLAGRGVTPLEYIFAKVLRPIGATYADWATDRSGAPYFSTGAKLTARDLAKFGELVRTRGRAWIWPVIPEGEFDASREGSAANSMYGLSFWLNRNARRAGAGPISVEGTLGDDWSPERWRLSSLSAVAPPDLIAMIGSGGIRCYVVPMEKLVVVRFGTGRGFSDSAFLDAVFGK